MPLYLRKVGQEAEKEREEAIDRERKRAQKRAILMSSSQSGELRRANENMSNLQKVRQALNHLRCLKGKDISPRYTIRRRAAGNHTFETDGEQSERLWKAWCPDVNEWQNKEYYEQCKQFHVGHLSPY